MGEWWCSLVEVDGKQVIFKRAIAPNADGEYRIRVVVEASDWLEGSKEGETTVSIFCFNEPITAAQFDIAVKMDVKELVGRYILPLLSYCKRRG